jgi:integrase
LSSERFDERIAKRVETGKGTVENIANRYLDSVRLDVSIKPSMVRYREEIVTSIFKTWANLKGLAPKSVTATDCEQWAAGHAKKYSGTHHDLRHLFATRCIESGVDIPTVSRWLGHRDGGALAMRTYGHLGDEHSKSMAAKVSF